MRLEEARDYLLAKRAVTEDMLFGPDVLVFRVGGKILPSSISSGFLCR